ncbi:MAG TPA: hypothetical protein VJQ82_17270 [Terriglobales bacterium]|nr:hypothetical protein [Terriglobales bacterium]
MERTLKLALNKFDQVPKSLIDGKSGCPLEEITVNLTSLYHHYYLDSYGRIPPDPDPAQFEYLRFLLPTSDFRLKGDGIGVCTAVRRHSSTALGQAFCRWFLHEHVGITYFAHMQHVLDKPPAPGFDGLKVQRVDHGDVPDYLCAEEATKGVFIAEAKGRYSAINFKNREFASWRKQFERVLVTDGHGLPRTLKGYIVGTRYATEESASTVQSGLAAEDPQTPGEKPLDAGETRSLAAAIAVRHYADIATKLNQPRLGAALESGAGLPDQYLVNAVIWEYQGLELAKRRFVGGYYPNGTGVIPIQLTDERQLVRRAPDPLRLDVGEGTFFGLEESIFRQIVQFARRSARDSRGREVELPNVPEFSRYEQTRHFYSAISILRDGSIFAPVEFFSPVQPIRI